MKNNRKRCYISKQTATVAQTSPNVGSADNIIGLQSLVEGIVGDDGSKAKVSRIRVHYWATSRKPFLLQPIVVQTAGTFADTYNIAIAQSVDEMLDTAINDVFGYHTAHPLKGSRKVPTSEQTSATATADAVQGQFDLPQHLLQLINKEVETERLQNLYLGFLGVWIYDSTSYIEVLLEVDFEIVKKTIVIR